MSREYRRLALGLLLFCSACVHNGHRSAVAKAPVATSTLPSPVATAPATAAPATRACSNQTVLGTWPVASLAARVIVAPVLDYDRATLDAAAASGVGGILFLGPDPPPVGLAALIASSRPPIGEPAPLVMADEEGGAVQRLVGAVMAVPSERAVAAADTPAQIEALGASVGAQMLRAGVTTDLAPVLDVDAGQGPSATDADGTRSYSGDPAVAAAAGAAMMRGLRSAGVLPVVKHFPGLGGATGNTDVGPAATPPLDVLERVGLAPFRTAIADGAPAIMVANASVPGLTTLPATLSKALITGLLRQQLHFKGLVVTDSLSAGAVTGAGYTLSAAAVAAVAAGADMVLWGSTLTPADTAELAPAAVASTDSSLVDALVDAEKEGTLRRWSLVAAVAAIDAAEGADLCSTTPPHQ